ADIVAHAEHERVPDLGFRRKIIGRNLRIAARNVHYQHVRLETLRPREEPAAGIESATSSIENQIVVASDLVYVGDRQSVFLGHVPEHLLSEDLLAGLEGGSGKVQNGLGAGPGQRLDGIVVIPAALPEIAVVPDVLTDAHSQTESLPIQDLR